MIYWVIFIFINCSFCHLIIFILDKFVSLWKYVGCVTLVEKSPGAIIKMFDFELNASFYFSGNFFMYFEYVLQHNWRTRTNSFRKRYHVYICVIATVKSSTWVFIVSSISNLKLQKKLLLTLYFNLRKFHYFNITSFHKSFHVDLARRYL